MIYFCQILRNFLRFENLIFFFWKFMVMTLEKRFHNFSRWGDAGMGFYGYFYTWQGTATGICV
jgi:hypothetical protein